jgi:hypothetical protein
VWASTRVVELDTVTLRIIGLAALRKHKAASGRSKDRADLKLLPKEK